MMNRSNMALVRAFVILLAFSRLCIASSLPIYIEDSHTGSFEFFANRLDLDESYTLVLFDAHSDASVVDGSDRVRAALRNVRSVGERLAITQSLRDSGRVQPYSWIEPLMPRPISRVIWVPGDGFSSEEIAELELEARAHLDWKLQVDERACGQLGQAFEVKNFSQLQGGTIDQRLIVSVDMDVYAQVRVKESDFDLHWEWIIKQPKLEALSFAISRPWLRSDAQAERLMVAAFKKCLLIGNAEIQYEPYRYDKRDRSLKAKSLIQGGEDVPRFDVEGCSVALSDVLVQNADRITVHYEAARWLELIERWQNKFTQIGVYLKGVDQSIDGVWRSQIDGVSDIWLECEGEATAIKWWLLEPESSAYDVLPKIPLGKNFTSSEVTSFVSEKRRMIAETTEPVLSSRTWAKYLPAPNTSGVIRLQAEVQLENELRVSEVVELRVSSRNGFLGALSEQFGSPYVFGIGSITHKGERAGEALLGNDCANFLIYGFRQVGRRFEWGNPKQLRNQLHVLAANCDGASRVQMSEQGIGTGVILDFGSHVAAVWKDIGELGVLDPEDEVVHHLGGFPELVKLSALLKKYSKYGVLIPDPSESLSTLCFGGDVNFDGADKDVFSKKLIDVTRSTDLAIVNLECAIREGGGSEEEFNFVAAPEYLDCLTEAGVDGVVVANNHAYDAGSDGLDSTIEALSEREISVIGADENKTIFKVGEHQIGLIAFNAVELRNPPTDQRVPQYSTDRGKLEQVIIELQMECDAVIALPHWGDEYTTKISNDQRSIAQWLVRAGVDAVIGCHPHIRQKVEYYRGVPVAYSLGNLYFPNRGPKGFNDYALLLVEWYEKNNRFEVRWIIDK